MRQARPFGGTVTAVDQHAGGLPHFHIEFPPGAPIPTNAAGISFMEHRRNSAASASRGMRAELFDIDRDGCCQALRAQHVKPGRRVVGVCQKRQLVPPLALFEVTKGGVFWMVALGPAKCAIRAFCAIRFDLLNVCLDEAVSGSRASGENPATGRDEVTSGAKVVSHPPSPWYTSGQRELGGDDQDRGQRPITSQGCIIIFWRRPRRCATDRYSVQLGPNESGCPR
jgi:hypothetical protein